jgi:hypothetical protein
MAVLGRRVAVVATTPATQIFRGGARTSEILVKNIGSVEVDLGGSSVTAGTGYRVSANDVVGPFTLRGGDVLYGVSSSGTQTVQILVMNA